jgi:hypothetical protein
MTDLQFYKQFLSLPDDLKKEAEDFVDFLVEKTKKNKPLKEKKAPIPGLAKGLIEMKEGFDDPLEDFKDYM